jgi:hypothetical protein
MVILHVIEEWGEAHVPGPCVRDPIGVGDEAHAPILREHRGDGEAACERHRRSIYRRSAALDTARDDARPLDRACRFNQ